jgi:FlaG/FlaF family flagellin (archaellin)
MNVGVAIRERFDRLEAREQRLLTIFGSVLAVLLLVAIPIALAATTASRKKENDSMREAMSSIAASRADLERLEMQRVRVELRYAHPAPPLAGFLEQNASAHSIEIPESQDRPPVPHSNKRYDERSTKIELQKVGMKNLSLFLEGIDNSGFPVRVSALSIRKRATENDSWDVSVTISAFDRKVTEKPKPAASGEEEAEAP